MSLSLCRSTCGCSRFYNQTVCRWALAAVRQHFWGLRWWERRFVVLLLGNFKLGQEYFIDGTHFPGLLTRFFPFITLRPCGQSSEVEGSVELRLLHEGSSRTGVRIIGKVERFAERSIQALPQVNVRITDSAGSFITTTDAHGIYDVTDLPPGRFGIEIVSPNLEKPHCEENDVKVGQAWGCTLTVFGIR